MTRLSHLTWRLALLLPLTLLFGCSSMTTSSPRTVQSLDLDRYMGRWYVIAHTPYFLERGKVATYDTYARRPDGKMTNNFTFRKGTFDAPEKTWEGVAWIANPTTQAEWKVQFIWPLSTSYFVHEVDPNYQWAVVGTGKDVAWILSRERQMSASIYDELIKRVAFHGYDAGKMAKIPQPEN